MAHPKRQHSKQRQRKRRTHQKLSDSFGDLSPKGSQMGYQHGVDPITGMYKGKQIVDVAPRVSKKKEA